MNDTRNNTTVSVVIPTLNAMGYLPALRRALRAQQPCPPAEILLVDSGSKDGTVEYVAGLGADVHLIEIDRFSHGRARNLGVQNSRGDFVVFMSQDAVPKNDVWLTALVEPLANPRVAAAFSKQEPRAEATPMESFFLHYHFPPGFPVQMCREGKTRLAFQNGIFFSNVSAVVRRSMALKYPFDEHVIMSEDQAFARDIICAGYAIVYTPVSVVLHSHEYDLVRVFKRYFDSVYSLGKIFPDLGIRTTLLLAFSYLRKEVPFMFFRHPTWLPYYLAYTTSKAAAAAAAQFADRMPRKVVKRLSQHSSWWGP